MNQTFIAIGGILNSALYLAGVFVAALFAHNHIAECLALAAFGLTFLSYMVQALPTSDRLPAVLTSIASIVASVAAGASLALGFIMAGS